MKKTVIKELVNVDLKNPILVEGFPGLGMVGSIATQYLNTTIKNEKIGTFAFSPFSLPCYCR